MPLTQEPPLALRFTGLSDSQTPGFASKKAKTTFSVRWTLQKRRGRDPVDTAAMIFKRGIMNNSVK